MTDWIQRPQRIVGFVSFQACCARDRVKRCAMDFSDNTSATCVIVCGVATRGHALLLGGKIGYGDLTSPGLNLHDRRIPTQGRRES